MSHSVFVTFKETFPWLWVCVSSNRPRQGVENGALEFIWGCFRGRSYLVYWDVWIRRWAFMSSITHISVWITYWAHRTRKVNICHIKKKNFSVHTRALMSTKRENLISFSKESSFSHICEHPICMHVPFLQFYSYPTIQNNAITSIVCAVMSSQHHEPYTAC